MARCIWETALLAIAFVLVSGGVADFGLWLRDETTVSQLLRERPAWFWWPAGLMVLFLVLLALHLFFPGPQIERFLHR